MSDSHQHPGEFPIDPALLARLKAVVGTGGYLEGDADTAPYCVSWRDDFRGRTPLVLRPDSTAQVAEIVRVCAEAGVPIVPQGGNTGLTGASQPHAEGGEVILSTTRLNRIRAVDPANDTITAEAGVVLADLQRAAAEVGRLFPLSLAAEGSCRIGGNIATNAGGTQVLRYGNTRNLVLGLEVVLPDGRVWDGLRGLRKDNTGYDMKQLFIGAEGTLGVITAAVLRLFPRPGDTQTALLAIPDPQAAVTLLGRLRARLGDSLSAIELMAGICLRTVVEALGHGHPFSQDYPWYVLLEVSGPGEPGALRGPLEAALAEAFEAGLALDGVLAESREQAGRLWALREDQSEAQKHLGASLKHDISVPVSRIPAFLERADAALRAAYPGIRPYAFGHVGDGNLHYNPNQPPDWSAEAFRAERAAVNRIVHDIVMDLGGSISAEHGLGRLRLAEAEHYKPAVELDMMRSVKRALDPQNIMNPGKVLRLHPDRD